MDDQSVAYEGVLRRGSAFEHEVPFTVVKEGVRVDSRAAVSVQGISIRLDGYESATGIEDSIIHIELDVDGKPVLHVWPDINDEQPTSISLAGAHASLREWIDDDGE